MSLSVQTKTLHSPPLEEVADIIRKGISSNFQTVDVAVVDCPDLSEAPYSLPAKGICGSPRIADVGGVPNLLPLVDETKIYDFAQLTELTGLPNAFVVGAGAGPFNSVGVNSEMMPNLVTGNKASNNSRICRIEDGSPKLEKLAEDQGQCGLMMNMFVSEGLPGKLIRVRAKKRIASDNFTISIRKCLERSYPEQMVALGGVFRVLRGHVKCHVMPPAFSACPLNTEDQLNKWLKFFNFSAPMMFFSVLVSRDPGMDIRLEHSHGYGDTYGGHYHYDITPDEVEYEGLFHVAEEFYRIDKPNEVHSFDKPTQ